MKRFVLLFLMLFAISLPVYAACTTPPTTSGSSGYQSKTRYISAIRANSANTHSLRVSWSYAGGTFGGTSTIDLGSGSAIVVKAGSDCTESFEEASPGTGDCAGTIGWESSGDSDRLYNFWASTGGFTGSVNITKIMINGVKYLELYNVTVNQGNSWHWNDTGLTKLRSDNVGDGWLYFDGYESNVLVTKSLHLVGNGC